MAKKVLTQSTVATDNIQNQPDQVVSQAVALKLSFDQYGIDSKAYNNNTLLVELQSETVGTSGSNAIGHGSANITANNVGDALEEIKADITGVVLGQIPDNSLTNAKLASDVKVGSLATLTTTEKGSVVGAINELDLDVGTNTTNLDIIRTAKTDTGVADAYIVDTDGTFDLTKDGNVLNFVPVNSNTGVSAIVVDGLASKAIKKADDTGTLVDLEEGDIGKNKPAQLVWSVGNDFFILRPSGGKTIKSIQRGTATIASGTSITYVNISPVNIAKSIIKISFQIDTATGDSNEGQIQGKLNTTNQIKLSRYFDPANATGTISWVVIEFDNVKSVQSGFKFTNTSSENTVIVSAVNVNKSMLFKSYTSQVGSVSYPVSNAYDRIINSTTIGFKVQSTQSIAYEWYLVEFN